MKGQVQGESSPESIGILTVLKCICGPYFQILTSIVTPLAVTFVKHKQHDSVQRRSHAWMAVFKTNGRPVAPGNQKFGSTSYI